MDAVGLTVSARAKRLSRKAETAATRGTPWLSITLEGIFAHFLVDSVIRVDKVVDIRVVDIGLARNLNVTAELGEKRVYNSSVAGNSLCGCRRWKNELANEYLCQELRSESCKKKNDRPRSDF